jgi:hypothetical protein
MALSTGLSCSVGVEDIPVAFSHTSAKSIITK